MQTVIAVHCGRRDRTSLRDAIVSDPRLEDFQLLVRRQQKAGRNPGWAKIGALEPGELGVINIEWDGSPRLPGARFIPRARRPPARLLARFIEYLMERHRRRIRSITISPALP